MKPTKRILDIIRSQPRWSETRIVGFTVMSHKRSPQAIQKREHKTSLKRQAHSYILNNSFKDTINGEVINTVTPAQVVSFLNVLNSGIVLDVISPNIYGTIVDVQEGVVVQASQGLVLENGVKY